MRSTVKIDVQKKNKETREIGTGFHIGGGYIATAKHVIENADYQVIAHKDIGSSTRKAEFCALSNDPAHHEEHALKVEQEFFPADSKIDIAVIKTDFNSDYWMSRTVSTHWKKKDHFQLDYMLYDEDLYETDILLREVFMIGYPRIPYTDHAYVVCVRADINALVGKMSTPHGHLILSSTARGGFSGAPVLNQHGKVIGICTESLNENDKLVEAGFTAALSIQPLNELLSTNNIFPHGDNYDLISEVNERQEAYSEWKQLRAEGKL